MDSKRAREKGGTIVSGSRTAPLKPKNGLNGPPSGTDPSPLHFAGQQYDSESNLTRMEFRSLSTTQGRWTAMDPSDKKAADTASPQSWNLYSYVMNNPIISEDPSGLLGFWVVRVDTGDDPDSTCDQHQGICAAGQPAMGDTPAPTAGSDGAQNTSNQQTQGNQSQSNQQGHWEYSQSTGQMTHVLPDGTKKDVGTGYSGKDDGLKNPKAQDQPNVGPIPQGNWKIEPQKDNVTGQGHKLPASMRLDPSKGTDTFGRSGFLIHGDNSQQNHSASNGCIILDRPTRNLIGGSGDNNLTVVP